MVHTYVPYKGQKYEQLKKRAQSSNRLFIDREFPPDDSSLFFKGSSKKATITWKRPKEICNDPKLFVQGISANDLVQGDLGNCWFVAACCCLAVNKLVWKKVIPDHEEQDFSSERRENEYAGIFHFRFWRFGQWIDVVIDDNLPTIGGRLVYCHARVKNEFWCALLEKAYAKLYGCYEALDGGELSDALEDFTGGVNEPVEMADYRDNDAMKDALFERMSECLEHKALMAAAIPAKSQSEMEAKTEIGLVVGHAYGLTAARTVHIKGTGIFNKFGREKLRMVRLQNPWGGTEWKGAFSDGSEEWKKISRSEREKLGLTFDDDGQFWMTYDDYVTYFTMMAICQVLNTSMFSVGKTWIESVLHGSWSTPDRSGGCVNNKAIFLNNPQYRFDVDNKDEEFIFALTQKTTRINPDIKNATIGFTILKVEHNRTYRMHRSQAQEIVKSSIFKNSRSVHMKLTLPKGRYVAVMCTFEPDVVANFLLRLYSGSSCNLKELTKDAPGKGLLCCTSSPKMVTQVKVLRAEGLELPKGKGAINAYCTVNCEGNRAAAPPRKQQNNPEWNWGAIYYRKKPTTKPITFEVWHSGAVGKDFLGQHTLDLPDEVDQKVIELELFNRKDKSTERRPGKLYIQVTNTPDMNMI